MINTIRNSLYNNTNNGMLGNNSSNLYIGNPMSIISPKSNLQIIKVQNSSSNGVINKSFEPGNDLVQSPLLDKNLLAKKSPYKVQDQRSTVDFRNLATNGHTQNTSSNFRSNSTAH